MKVAGVREIKNRLSHYLRLVAEGEVVLVTDRGTVVAQLGPPPVQLPLAAGGERAALERLARLGGLRLGAAGPLPSGEAPIPPRVAVDVAAILAQTRADL
jgi:antitoxin (DNA-binding transcriptional repressor) of toxin-antitoxin stability system